MNWVYSNDDGQLSNQHRLLAPYGDTPLDQVTEEVAVSWLEEQLQNTAEELDRSDCQSQGRSRIRENLGALRGQLQGSTHTHPHP